MQIRALLISISIVTSLLTLHIHAHDTDEKGYVPSAGIVYPDYINVIYFNLPNNPNFITVSYWHFGNMRHVRIYKGGKRSIRVNSMLHEHNHIYISIEKHEYIITFPKAIAGQNFGPVTEIIVANYLDQYMSGQRPLPAGFTIKQKY